MNDLLYDNPEPLPEEPLPDPPRELTQSEWELEGAMIARRDTRTRWALARWLVIGRGWDKGFKRSQAITGYADSTLWNLYRTAAGFPEHVCLMEVPFAVHTELLRETRVRERYLLLTRAAKERWRQEDAVRYFRERVTTADRSDHPKSQASYKSYQPVRFQCPHCQHVFPGRDHKYQEPTDAGSPEEIQPDPMPDTGTGRPGRIQGTPRRTRTKSTPVSDD